MSFKNKDVRIDRSSTDSSLEFSIGLDNGIGSGDILIRLNSGDISSASLDGSSIPASNITDASISLQRLTHNGTSFIASTDPTIGDSVMIDNLIVPYPSADYDPSNKIYTDTKQSKDTGAVDGNIAEFLSEQTVDSGIGTADLVLYSDLHLANSIWANPTDSSAVFQDFQVTSNSLIGRAGADIENIEVAVEQVVGRFLGDLTALDQTEVNDGGHSSTRNDVNDLLHWTVGTRYRSWDDISIGTSLTDESILGLDYFSGSGAAPNNGTTFFFPAGSLKEGMNIKLKAYQTVGATDNVTLKVRFNSTNIGSITLTANESHMTEIDLIVTSISDITGGLKALYSDSSDGASDGSSAVLDTVNDATIDLVVDTGATTGTEVKMSEILIAG